MGATVTSMWRYPVKSMLGEEIASTGVGERGLAGDRAYALIDVETGHVVSAKNPRRWGALFSCSAEYLEAPAAGSEPPPVRMTMPDGTSIRSDQADADDALSGALGRAVRLQTNAPAAPVIEDYHPEVEGIDDARSDTVSEGQIALLAPGTFFDAAALHVVTTSTLTALADAYPSGRFDARRFRPNMVIDTSSESSDGAESVGRFPENAWVDHVMRVGSDVTLAIVLATPRCVMTTLPQRELPADKGILQTIARENRFDIPGLGPSSCVGVYGMVSAGGAVSLGDSIELRK